MGLLLLAEKGGMSTRATGFVRTGSIALILGGLAGAVLGAIPTFYNPKDDRARNDPSIRKPTAFPSTTPTKLNELAGIELASVQVPTTKGDLKRMSIYLDPKTAKKSAAKTLDAAILQARAAVQADTTAFRSQAVVQTADGAYWIAQLTGDVDQIDGRFYTDKNDFDARYAPQLVRKQPSLQAVVGVSTKVTFDDPPEVTTIAPAPAPTAPKIAGGTR